MHKEADYQCKYGNKNGRKSTPFPTLPQGRRLQNCLARPEKMAHPPEEILETPEEIRILQNLNGTVWYHKLRETAKRLGFRERLEIKRRP